MKRKEAIIIIISFIFSIAALVAVYGISSSLITESGNKKEVNDAVYKEDASIINYELDYDSEKVETAALLILENTYMSDKEIKASLAVAKEILTEDVYNELSNRISERETESGQAAGGASETVTLSDEDKELIGQTDEETSAIGDNGEIQQEPLYTVKDIEYYSNYLIVKVKNRNSGTILLQFEVDQSGKLGQYKQFR